MPVRKADIRSGVRLSSPTVQQATIPDTLIKPATSSSDTPIYQVITLQFITIVFNGGKDMGQKLIYQYKNIYPCIDKIN